MLTTQRKQLLLARLQQDGQIVAKAFSEELGISEDTVRRDLRELAAEGLAVIIISDDIPEVIQNCNRVMVMNAGRIVAEVDPAVTGDAELAELMSKDIVDLNGKG